MLETISKVLGLALEESMSVRDSIQEAVTKLTDRFLILNWSMRSGKTKAVLMSTLGQKVLCFTPQILLHQTHKDEAEKWNVDISKFEFACYNSSQNYMDTEWDVLWLDECQGVTDRNIEHLITVKTKRIICTSGTIPSDKLKLLYQLGKPRIIKIALKQGIEWEFLKPPTIYVIDRPLNKGVQHIFVKGKDKSKNTVSCTYNDWISKYKFISGVKRPNCNIHCNEVEYYALLQEELDNITWRAQNTNANRRIIEIQRKQIGTKRKSWLNNLKTEYAKQICDSLRGKRFIVFTNDIAQCEEVARGKTTVHSNHKNEVDAQSIQDFNDGIINELYAVNKMDVGVTLYDFDAAIHVSLSGSEIAPSQRTGRSLAGNEPIIYVIRVPNTRDDEFFKEFKRPLDDSYFKYIQLKDTVL